MSYQSDIVRFRAYSKQNARAHIALQLFSEAGEIAGFFGKQLYKTVNVANLIEELGDQRHYLAQLCTEIGLQLTDITPRPVPDMSLDRRALRLGARAARMGDCLLLHYDRVFFEVEVAYQLHDLDWIRKVAETLSGQVWTWDAIERANVEKLTGDPSKRAAAL